MRFRYIYTIVLALLLVGVFIFTCICSPIEVAENNSEYTVYASIYPVYAICAKITRDVPGITVHQLLQPTDNNLDSYSLSDWDYALLENSDIAVFAGNGLETFASTYTSSSTTIITATSGLVLAQDTDGNVNPWIFMSADGMAEFAEAICANFVTVDEAYADTYLTNLDSFSADVTALKTETEAALSDMKLVRTAAITAPEIQYLCEDFGIGCILLSDFKDITDAFYDSGADFLLIDERGSAEYSAELETSGIDFAVIDTGLNHSESEGPDKWLEIYKENVIRLQGMLE